jgi:hypothetical protein
VKHLTALVEEAARKNHSLIAIGSELPVIVPFPLSFTSNWLFFNLVLLVAEAREKTIADTRAGYVNETLLKEVEKRAGDYSRGGNKALRVGGNGPHACP